MKTKKIDNYYGDEIVEIKSDEIEYLDCNNLTYYQSIMLEEINIFQKQFNLNMIYDKLGLKYYYNLFINDICYENSSENSYFSYAIYYENVRIKQALQIDIHPKTQYFIDLLYNINRYDQIITCMICIIHRNIGNSKNNNINYIKSNIMKFISKYILNLYQPNLNIKCDLHKSCDHTNSIHTNSIHTNCVECTSKLNNHPIILKYFDAYYKNTEPQDYLLVFEAASKIQHQNAISFFKTII